MSKKCQGSTINNNLLKRSQIGSLENVSMPKTQRGSTIDDNFIVVKNAFYDPYGFSPILIKCVRHRLSMISFHPSLTSVLLVFYRCRRGSTISRTFMRKNLRKKTLPFVDADEYRLSTTVVF
jgi:hypothetical protein